MTCPCTILIVMIDTVILAVTIRTMLLLLLFFVVVVVEYPDLILLLNKAVTTTPTYFLFCSVSETTVIQFVISVFLLILLLTHIISEYYALSDRNSFVRHCHSCSAFNKVQYQVAKNKEQTKPDISIDCCWCSNAIHCIVSPRLKVTVPPTQALAVSEHDSECIHCSSLQNLRLWLNLQTFGVPCHKVYST